MSALYVYQCDLAIQTADRNEWMKDKKDKEEDTRAI